MNYGFCSVSSQLKSRISYNPLFSSRNKIKESRIEERDIARKRERKDREKGINEVQKERE